MAMYDERSDLLPEIGLDIQVIGSNTTTVGNEIDMQAFEALTFVLETGAYTDGAFELLVEESDVSGSGYATVDADFLVGVPGDETLGAANLVATIGYVGKKQYVRASVVSTGVTTGATVGVVALKQKPIHGPAV